jgi:hypothetical protein
MKKNYLLGLAATAGLALSLLASPASAVSVSIGFSQPSGGAVTTVVTDNISPGVAAASFGAGPFTTNIVTGQGTPPGSLPSLLDSTSLNTTTTGAGTIDIYVSVKDITGPIGTPLLNFLSNLTSNTLPSGWTATLSTFLDPGNAFFAKTIQLATNAFTNIGVSQQSKFAATGPGPYSLTALYTISASTNGTALSTINVSVPGPIVGAGLPGLLAACFGLVALARLRRRNAVATA